MYRRAHTHARADTRHAQIHIIYKTLLFLTSGVLLDLGEKIVLTMGVY